MWGFQRKVGMFRAVAFQRTALESLHRNPPLTENILALSLEGINKCGRAGVS